MLISLFVLGFTDEAAAFKLSLERTGAGRPEDLQIVYGIGGERHLPELVLPHLEGHRGSKPVRIGNAAVKQLQDDWSKVPVRAMASLVSWSRAWSCRSASTELPSALLCPCISGSTKDSKPTRRTKHPKQHTSAGLQDPHTLGHRPPVIRDRAQAQAEHHGIEPVIGEL